MNDTAIELIKVSKKYDIRARNKSTFLEKISKYFSAKSEKKEKNNILWALKDISFNVKKGEAVGIIGANGSGKTTILRLLSGVTYQKTGRINVNGTIAPLIQVGAGFHPELTGRENIYLNGIILGLTRKQIDEKYDEIVRFAELERFVDTPVKRYSSGMYVRLGFSVAIHVDSEILLIDEILSVGDLSFQRKCLEVMSEIRRSDKSIVFVSHNLSAVRGLCDRVIWLNNGKVEAIGNPEEVISAYTQFMEKKSEFINDCNFIGQKTRWGTGEARLKKVAMLNSSSEEEDNFMVGEEVRIRLEYETSKRLESPTFWVGIINNDEVKITGTYFNKDRAGKYTMDNYGVLECSFKQLHVRPGVYHVMVGIYDEYGLIAYDRIGRVKTFTVKNEYMKGFEGFRGYGAHGIVDFANEWQLHEV